MNDRMCFADSVLTTPIAYIAGFFPDPFASQFQGPPIIHTFEYLNLTQHVNNFGAAPPPFAAKLIPAWGRWRMAAAGPDQDRGVDIKNNIVYDATNGTVSDGDIVRCQRYSDNRINLQAP